jgi:NAD+-dependent protein deacetylase SIR2
MRLAPALRDADLLLILGTSLKVYPFAGLTRLVDFACPRVLINLEEAGDIGTRPNDVVALGTCDDVVRSLARELGWEAALDAAWAQTRPTREKPTVGEAVQDVQEKAAAEGLENAKNAAQRFVTSRAVERLADIMNKKLEIVERGAASSTSPGTATSAGDVPVSETPAVDDRSRNSPKRVETAESTTPASQAKTPVNDSKDGEPESVQEG